TARSITAPASTTGCTGMPQWYERFGRVARCGEFSSDEEVCRIVEVAALAVGGKGLIAAAGLRVYTPRFRSQNCSGW
ncbi:hypothetical protein, partial [Nocardia cerradoensis]|uniref:hypothetical protein n=1 Tax=Nocardia cerradoensis TaxID=85688 RepID=UPI001CB98CDD